MQLEDEKRKKFNTLEFQVLPKDFKTLLRKIVFQRILLSMGKNLPWKKGIFIMGKIDTITKKYMENPEPGGNPLCPSGQEWRL